MTLNKFRHRIEAYASKVASPGILRNYLLVFLLPLLFSLSSCQTTHYMASPQHVPGLREARALQASAHYAVGESTFSLGGQMAYSPLQGVALSAGYHRFEADDREEQSTSSIQTYSYGLDGQQWEFALGYYDWLGKDAPLHLDLFLGLAQFEGQTYDFERADLDLAHQRWFLQPSFGYRHEWFEVFLSTRINRLQITQADYQLPVTSLTSPNYFLSTNESYWLVEPALTARVGFRYIMLQVQYQLVFGPGGDPFYYSPQTFSAGLSFRLEPSLRNKAPVPEGVF